MADFVNIDELNLGTTFGGWYFKNNVMIERLNALNVANIIGGDGITASPHTGANGGYTLSLSGTVSRDMTFNNVTVTGNLVSNFAGAVSGTTIVLPANTGVTVGNIVYIDSTGKLEKALADDECTAEVVGIVIGFTGDNAQVATTGRISGSSIIEAFTGTVGATLQKGVVYFLSGGVSGAGTTLEPDVTSYVSKPMLLGLTGDSGLILPYRGFIATEGTLGNTTIVQGVCGGAGVLSVNGLTASIFLGQGGQGNPAIRKTTGHIHAVNEIKIGNKGFVRSFVIDDNNPTPKNPGGIHGIPPAYKIITETVSGSNINTKITTNKNSSNELYLSTLGTIDDVYRLHRIRITTKTNPSININFIIKKAYNNVGSSNYIDHFGTTPGNFTQSYIEYRMKNYAIYPGESFVYNGSLSAEAATGLASVNAPTDAAIVETPASHLFTPHLRLPYGGTTPLATAGITASTVTGVLDSSGVYPVIYSKLAPNYTQTPAGYNHTDGNHRIYAWNFNSVILNTQAISGYLRTTAQAVDYVSTDTSGYTLDSSILGWNAQFGAIPECVFISFPSLDAMFTDQVANPIPTELHSALEVYKYNPTTGVTGPIMMITKDFTYSSEYTNYYGIIATNNGSA
jgi:hypothetical protein